MATFVYGTSNVADWRIYLNGRPLTTLTSGASDDELSLTYNGNNTHIGRLGKSNAAADSYFNGQINNVGPLTNDPPA